MAHMQRLALRSVQPTATIQSLSAKPAVSRKKLQRPRAQNASTSRAKSTLPPWLTILQVAEQLGVDRAEVYYRLLQKLEVRRIGTRGGAAPWGRLIRVERGSVLRMCGELPVAADVLPRWVTLSQAATYYQVSQRLVRKMVAHEQLDAARIGSGRTIRIDRDSLMQLGRIRDWSTT